MDASLWNGAAGNTWVAAQDMLDRMYQPIENLIVQAIPAEARRVLDVGCGTGSIVHAIARRLGPDGHCTGIDVSAPMLAAAAARGQPSNIRYILDDAQQHVFEAASFDAIVSRFGLMFFDDPVAAFRNLRQAARERATLHAIVWRSPEENPFMTAAERSAADLLPGLPVRRPDEPGQFGLANRQRLHAILEQSGWRDIDIAPLDVVCSFPKNRLYQYLTQLGPVGRALQTADEHTRQQVAQAVRAGFEPYVHGDEVGFTAACWHISARNIQVD